MYTYAFAMCYCKMKSRPPKGKSGGNYGGPKEWGS